jgi:arylsulfatase A-like enzyme
MTLIFDLFWIPMILIRKIRIVYTILMLLSFNLVFSQKENNNSSPNFIVILVDDQGWSGTSVQMKKGDTSSMSDYHHTPNLEKLAAKGMRFSQAYSTSPVCAPSRYSLQFGKSAARLNMIRVQMSTDHIDHTTEMTIPKILKKVNPKYVSAHFGKWGMGIGNSKLGVNFGVHPSVLGYDYSDGKTANKDGGFQPPEWKFSTSNDPKKIYSLTQRSIDFIEQQSKSNNPFFLQLSHYAVHSNIEATKRSLEKYEQKEKGKIHKNTYFAALTDDLDDSVGILLDKLQELGIANNTYVIYCSDNGAVPTLPPRKKYKHSYNFPLSRGKWDATEGGIRIPFIVSGPKIKPNTFSDIPVSLTDILPTIADLSGYSLRGQMKTIDGGSIKKVLFNSGFGKVKRQDNGFYFHVPYQNHIAFGRPHSSIIVDVYKLIKFHDNGELNLFDLSNDIGEQNNLAEKFPLKAKKLDSKMENYFKKHKTVKWGKGIDWKFKSIEEINSFY